MINRFFTTLFTNKRMVWYEEAGEEQTSITFYGHIQQASPDLAQSLGMTYTKTFIIWCPLATNVSVGDNLVNGSYTYSVKSIIERSVGTNTHLELVVEKDESYLI